MATKSNNNSQGRRTPLSLGGVCPKQNIGKQSSTNGGSKSQVKGNETKSDKQRNDYAKEAKKQQQQQQHNEKKVQNGNNKEKSNEKPMKDLMVKLKKNEVDDLNVGAKKNNQSTEQKEKTNQLSQSPVAEGRKKKQEKSDVICIDLSDIDDANTKDQQQEAVATTSSSPRTSNNKLEENVISSTSSINIVPAPVQNDATNKPADIVAPVSTEMPSPVVKTPTKATVERKSITPKKNKDEKQQASPLATAAAISEIAAQDKTKTPVKSAPTVAETENEDVEMASLVVEPSPVKATASEGSTNLKSFPVATSTPGKALATSKLDAIAKSDIYMELEAGTKTPDRKNCPRSFSAISGRRSIRIGGEYTPGNFESNLLYRESYRRINTELDVSTRTNTSLNVTVGSEVHNNSSFSLFGFGRKRERTPPNTDAAMDLQADIVSPPKRARLDGFFGFLSSPMTLISRRLSKATIKNTPANLRRSKLVATSDDDDGEVQNVSGISIEEGITGAGSSGSGEDDVTVAAEAAAIEVDPKLSSLPEKAEENAATQDEVNKEEPALKGDIEKDGLEKEITPDSGDGIDADAADNNSDIKIKETLIAVGNPSAKTDRCSIM